MGSAWRPRPVDFCVPLLRTGTQKISSLAHGPARTEPTSHTCIGTSDPSLSTCRQRTTSQRCPPSLSPSSPRQHRRGLQELLPARQHLRSLRRRVVQIGSGSRGRRAASWRGVDGPQLAQGRRLRVGRGRRDPRAHLSRRWVEHQELEAVKDYIDPTCPDSAAGRRYFGWLLPL